MKISTALSDAIDCIEDKIKRIAVDANLHDEYNANYPAAERASKPRLRLQEDVRILMRLQKIIEDNKLYIRLKSDKSDSMRYSLLDPDWKIPDKVAQDSKSDAETK